MRPIFLLTAMAATMAIACPALAQSAEPPVLAADEAPLPPMAEDQAQANEMAARLAALDTRIGQDEARMTTLRDGALAKENARIRAIRPALPFRGSNLLSH